MALAYPDRIAKSRSGGTGAMLLANGRGTTVDPASALAHEPFLTVAELAGSAGNSRVLLATPIAIEDIKTMFFDRIITRDEVAFDAGSASLRGRWVRRLGAILLAERPAKIVPNQDTALALAGDIGVLGLARLPWSAALSQWRARVNFLRQHEGIEWLDLFDAALLASISERLAPAFSNKTSLGDLSTDDLSKAMHTLLLWNLRKKLDHDAPTHFYAPLDSRLQIDYESSEGPKLSIRVQELFGLDQHPNISRGRVPLVVELLSPAHWPVRITKDLSAFWHCSYADGRTDLRGCYPKHPWPEDPLSAPPTHRAKPRGT